jgi:HEAT repeat protein
MTKILVLGIVALVGATAWIARATHEQPAAVATAQRGAAITPPGVAGRPPVLPARGLPSVRGLELDLRDPDPGVRRAAVRELVRDPGSDLQHLLTASRDRDLEVAIVATTALGTLYGRGELVAEELIARTTDHALDDRVRLAAINGLGVVASTEAARSLAELARRGDLLERRSAAILLVHQDPDLAVPALIDALADVDEVVTANALEALRTRSRGRDFGGDVPRWRAWWQVRSR